MLIVFIEDPERLRNFIEQEPLIVTKSSLEGIANLQASTSLYFGVGLVNREKVSEDLPIDVLSMMLVAERLGVKGKKYILIADVHARVNTPVNKRDKLFFNENIGYLAYNYPIVFDKIIRNLGLSNWYVLRASDGPGSKIFFEISDEANREKMYERLELRDIEAFRKNANVKLKIGWAFDSGGNLDETHFDRMYKEKFPHSEMSFLYVKPGMTFNPMKLRMAPYFCDDDKSRIGLLWHGRGNGIVEGKMAEAREKYGEQGIQCYRNYLKRLVRLFDTVIEPTRNGPLEQKLQEILDRCLK